jgi:hypothetical protein
MPLEGSALNRSSLRADAGPNWEEQPPRESLTASKSDEHRTAPPARPKCSPARRSGAPRRSRHRRRDRTRRTASRSQGADRGERMAVVRVPQLRQSTSSHSRPAISAARIVGDHSISRPAARCSFRRSITDFSSARGAIGELSPCIGANVEPARPDPHARQRRPVRSKSESQNTRRRQASDAAKARWTKAGRRIRDATAVPVCPLIDHLIGARQHRFRDGKADQAAIRSARECRDSPLDYGVAESRA